MAMAELWGKYGRTGVKLVACEDCKFLTPSHSGAVRTYKKKYVRTAKVCEARTVQFESQLVMAENFFGPTLSCSVGRQPPISPELFLLDLD